MIRFGNCSQEWFCYNSARWWNASKLSNHYSDYTPFHQFTTLGPFLATNKAAAPACAHHSALWLFVSWSLLKLIWASCRVVCSRPLKMVLTVSHIPWMLYGRESFCRFSSSELLENLLENRQELSRPYSSALNRWSNRFYLYAAFSLHIQLHFGSFCSPIWYFREQIFFLFTFTISLPADAATIHREYCYECHRQIIVDHRHCLYFL